MDSRWRARVASGTVSGATHSHCSALPVDVTQPCERHSPVARAESPWGLCATSSSSARRGPTGLGGADMLGSPGPKGVRSHPGPAWSSVYVSPVVCAELQGELGGHCCPVAFTRGVCPLRAARRGMIRGSDTVDVTFFCEPTHIESIDSGFRSTKPVSGCLSEGVWIVCTPFQATRCWGGAPGSWVSGL